MDLTQQYCLKWNNHQKNLLSVFEDLLNNGAFVDVTLACEGEQLKAHKMVLSACSPYFRSLLFNTPDRHPIVFLKDVRCAEMKSLLEFMYRGEVSVDQDRLSSFLKVAESLQIKGLAEVVTEQIDSHPDHFNSLIPQGLNQTPFGLNLGRLDLSMGHKTGSVFSSELACKTSTTSPTPPAQQYQGQKRKRVRPRRLSGVGAASMVTDKLDIIPSHAKIQPDDWITDNPEVGP